jgi:hypothetical protein
MAGMQMAFVDDDESFGREGLPELVFDRRLYGHCLAPPPYAGCRQSPPKGSREARRDSAVG